MFCVLCYIRSVAFPSLSQFSPYFRRDVADITDKVTGGKEGNKNKESDVERENNANGTGDLLFLHAIAIIIIIIIIIIINIQNIQIFD